MKQKHYLLLILSHAFIAVGCFLIYVYHVRSIFESRHNFGHISNLQREALLRKEDALYYSFYKTIVEEADFNQGYQKLLNVTTIEYPHTVNVVNRFHVFPEIVIGYLFHKFRSISRSFDIPIISCWSDDGNSLLEPVIICEGLGEPFHFYLEFVWMFGGFTVFLIYMYASFLSENLLGGIYAVASYVIFHKNASKIYDRPVSRENFAFPLIFWQMFYLCICIDKASKRKKTDRLYFNPIMIIKLTLLTTASLLCWQFSSVIYATQILIMIALWSLGLVSSRFSIDYTITQILSNIIAYYLTYENKKYFFAWQNGPALTLSFISLLRIFGRSRSENFLKSITLGILLAISSQGSIIDLLEKSGYANSTENPFSVYRDLVLQWTLQRKTNFTTCLLACNSDYEEVDINDVWEVIKILFAKPYCLYGVVLLAKFLRKWRIQAPKSENTDYVERAKNYALEEFLEENHVSMKDLSNVETQKALDEHMKLLEQCGYDFQKFKEEKNKLKKDDVNEHDSFLDEIKCLKKQIKQTHQGRKSEKQPEVEPEPHNIPLVTHLKAHLNSLNDWPAIETQKQLGQYNEMVGKFWDEYQKYKDEEITADYIKKFDSIIDEIECLKKEIKQTNEKRKSRKQPEVEPHNKPLVQHLKAHVNSLNDRPAIEIKQTNEERKSRKQPWVEPDNVENTKNNVLDQFLEPNHITMKDLSNVDTTKLNQYLTLLQKRSIEMDGYSNEELESQKLLCKNYIDLTDQFNSNFQKYTKEKKKQKKDYDNEFTSMSEDFEFIEKEHQKLFAQHFIRAIELFNNKFRKYKEEKDVNDSPRVSSDDKPSVSTSQVENEKEVKPKTGVSDDHSSESNDTKKPRPKIESKLNNRLSYHYVYSLAQFAVFVFIGFSIKKLFFLCYTQGCVLAPTLYSKLRSHKHSNLFLSISLAVFLTSIVEPGVVNVYEEYLPSKTHNDELENMLEWINLNTEKNAVFGGPVDIIGTVHLTTKRPIVNHAHLDMHQISERTESIYSVFSRQQSSEIYNQCSQLKIQYLILSFNDCSNAANNECDILTIWDEMQPAYRKYPQFCSELASKNVPSFLKVFSNKYYGVIKMFSQSVQLNLKQNKMPEKVM